MVQKTVRQPLTAIYRKLFDCYGPQHWWPAESPFEVIIGAILTHSAAWTNVEKAIANLKAAGVLSPAILRRLELEELARLIYPSGYYNAKALKIKAFVNWLGENYGDDLDTLFAAETRLLREKLLVVHGIGPETADSILLYAGNKPVFVIDAYTRRILSRVALSAEGDNYSYWQKLFMDNLPHDAMMFNEYHALLVQLGKNVCRKQPRCEKCCLREMCCYYLKARKE